QEPRRFSTLSWNGIRSVREACRECGKFPTYKVSGRTAQLGIGFVCSKKGSRSARKTRLNDEHINPQQILRYTRQGSCSEFRQKGACLLACLPDDPAWNGRYLRFRADGATSAARSAAIRPAAIRGSGTASGKL